MVEGDRDEDLRLRNLQAVLLQTPLLQSGAGRARGLPHDKDQVHDRRPPVAHVPPKRLRRLPLLRDEAQGLAAHAGLLGPLLRRPKDHRSLGGSAVDTVGMAADRDVPGFQGGC